MIKLAIIIWAVIMSIMYYGLFILSPTKQPANVHYFNKGDILYPDYICNDTLIVEDADGLNKAIAPIEQGLQDPTDGTIDSIIHIYCKQY